MDVVIPQHARSVRLPRKAFREICGIPLIGWAVIQSKAAHCVDNVYVSTESPEIAEIAEHYGAEIIWRPKWLQDKALAANAPIEHALKETGLDKKHEPFASRLATCTLFFPDDIDRMYARFIEAPDMPLPMPKQVLLAAEVQEAVAYKQIMNPWDRILFSAHIDKDRPILPIGGTNLMYADMYSPASRRSEWFLGDDKITDEAVDKDAVSYQMILGTGIAYYVPCKPWQTFDIDDEQDLEMVELFMEHKILQGRGADVYYEYAEQAYKPF